MEHTRDQKITTMILSGVNVNTGVDPVPNLCPRMQVMCWWTTRRSGHSLIINAEHRLDLSY